MREITIRTAVAVLALAAIAACGGGESLSERSDDAGGAGADLVTTKAPAVDRAKSIIDAVVPDADLNAALSPGVRERGIEMSTSEGYPPMEMFSDDGKTLIGLDPSLGRAIANKLGLKFAVENADFNAQLPGLITGRYNMIMSSMTDNAERRKQATFVNYVQAGAAFNVKRGNPDAITEPQDLCGRTVAVVDNGSSFLLTKKYAKDCKAAGKPAIKLLTFAADQEALLTLISGRADVNLTDYIVAADRARNDKNGVDAIAIAGTEALWGIALNPDDADLIKAVQAALGQLVQSGEYQKILAAWELEEMAIAEVTVNGGA